MQKKFNKIILLIMFSFIFTTVIYGESVFLKDGSIIEGKILKETKSEITIQTLDRTINKIDTKNVLRTLYSDDYKTMVNIIKLNGKSIKGYIVYEDRDSYLVRKDLDSSKEIKIQKKDINGILRKVKQPKRKILSIKTSKQQYKAYESIVVEYTNLPGTKYDWISIAKTGTSNEYNDRYQYTNRNKNGSITFNGLPPGDYEVRLYLDWAKGSYKISKKHAFTIIEAPDQDNEYILKTEKKVYKENEEIIVEFDKIPKSKHNWISIATYGTQAENYLLYQYLKKTSKGKVKFSGLGKGKYEVRIFLDWDKGSYKISKRYVFFVK